MEAMEACSAVDIKEEMARQMDVIAALTRERKSS
jgi:hypothetical protein